MNHPIVLRLSSRRERYFHSPRREPWVLRVLVYQEPHRGDTSWQAEFRPAGAAACFDPIIPTADAVGYSSSAPAGAAFVGWVRNPRLAEISRLAVVIRSQLSCLPPTLVGGQRSKPLLLKPASAGLLKEFKSPAEAGCQLYSRPLNHQLKLVANKNSCL